MSTPDEPQNPYGSGDPKDPNGAPPDPSATPHDPGGTPQSPGETPQYPAAPPPYGQGPAAPPPYGQGPAAPPPYPGSSSPQYPSATPYGSAPGGYGQPAGYGAAYPKNSLAVWSLVLGIVSYVLCCALLTGIPAVIVGNNAKKAVAQGEANNGGLATAGVILGWIAIALSLLGLVLVAILLASGGWAAFMDGWNESYDSTY